MNLTVFVAGFAFGLGVGAGGIVLYVRWKMNKQLTEMQENMEGMFDATEEVMDEFEGSEVPGQGEEKGEE